MWWRCNMPVLTVAKEYAANEALLEAYLDSALDSIEAFINATKLDDANIQDSGITASDKLIDASVVLTNMAANSVGSTQLIVDSVSAEKLASDVAGDGLTQASDGSLDVNVDDTTVEIAAGALRIKDGSILQSHMSTAPAAIISSGDSGSFSTSSTNYVNVTNLSATITTTGRPVLVRLIGPAATGANFIKVTNATGLTTGYYGSLGITRDAGDKRGLVALSGQRSGASTWIAVPSQSYWYVDVVAAGTYTYQMVAGVNNALVTIELTSCRLSVMEV
jgi:hypothetical protein